MPRYAPILGGSSLAAGYTLPPNSEWEFWPSVSSDFGADTPLDQRDGDIVVAGCAAGMVLEAIPNFQIAAAGDNNCAVSLATVVDGAIVNVFGPGATGALGWDLSADDVRRPSGSVCHLISAGDLDTDEEALVRLRPVFRNYGTVNVAISTTLAFGFAAPYWLVDGPLTRRRWNHLVADGQSLQRSASALDETVINQLGALVRAGGKRAVIDNFAVSASSFAERIANGRSERYRLTTIGYANNILIAFGGYDDIADGSTAQEILDAQTAQATEAKDRGFDRVIAITLTPSTTISGADETTRTDYNTLLKAAGGGVIDAVADAAAHANLLDPADTTYYSDGLHFTTAGAAAVASTVYPLLTGYLI